MSNRTYLITVLGGTLAIFVALGAVAQVTPDPVLRPGAVPTDPALSPDQTQPAPVLMPGAVQRDPALTPEQSQGGPVLSPGAVRRDPALTPEQSQGAPVLAPVPGDSLAPLPPIFPNRN